MAYFYGDAGTNGVAGSDGTPAPNGTTNGGSGGAATGGTAGESLNFLMEQDDWDPYLYVAGGAAGSGNYGGAGGAGGATTSQSYNGGGFLVATNVAVSNGGTGGAGGHAGTGGNATLTAQNFIVIDNQTFQAVGGTGNYGYAGGNGGSTNYGYYESNPYANGYYIGEVLHYYGYTHTQAGGAGGAGGRGGDGGSGGQAVVNVQSLEFQSYYLTAESNGGVGYTGGGGGSGGYGAVGGVGGRGGNGGAGGDATTSVNANRSGFASYYTISAVGGDGYDGGAGGTGGVGQTDSYSYTAPGTYTLTTTYNHGIGGRGGNGGNGGDAVVSFTNNQIMGGRTDETLYLYFTVESGLRGLGGFGGWNGAGLVRAANGTSGVSGDTDMTFSGNVLNGGSGRDTLSFSLTHRSADLARFASLGVVSVNLETGIFLFNGMSNNLVYIENVTLGVFEGYYDSGGSLIDMSPGVSLTGSASANILYTATGADTINAGAGDDDIYAGAGSDSINGGSGDDLIDGQAGADTMVGSTGDDEFYVDNIGDVVIETSNQGYDRVHTTVSFSLSGQHLEELFLEGSDSINGTGNNSDNLIVGNYYVNTLTGLNGNDTLEGYYGNDSLDGGANNDWLDGGYDADTMSGGSGNDTYVVDNVGDVTIETTGNGTDLVMSSITFSLAGQFTENLTLISWAGAIDGTGNSQNNILIGNQYNNALNGGAGADTMLGGYGDDTFFVDNIGDVISEGPGYGTDTVRSSLSYTLGVNLENLILTGSSNRDGTGNGLDNAINGNTGANTLNGMAGNDTLTGGNGADTFLFLVGSGSDTVADFNGGAGDKINLNAYTSGTAFGSGVTITDGGGGAWIDLGGGNGIFVTGVAYNSPNLLNNIIW